MPRTASIEIFKYEELSDKAKAKARDWFREATASDNDFAEYVTKDFKTIAGFCGWKIAHSNRSPHIFWSGFSSQGDGAQFEGGWDAANVEADKLREHAPQDEKLHELAGEFARLAKLAPKASASVKSRGHYSHEYCTEFEVVAEEVSEADFAQYETDLIEASRALMKWLYRSLEKEYEYQNADEQVAETIIANEYDFTEDGKRYHYE